MPTNPVPTMSTQGFVSDQAGKLDSLLSHFFLADYNQTFLYRGQVLSLPEIIQKAGGQAELVIPDLKSRLINYLGKYYNDCTVEVKPTTNLTTDAASKVELLLVIGVRDRGAMATYARLLQSSNSKLDKIIKLNNEDLATYEL